jgi:aerobic carbon-monoxide dehydrogenase large subunit
MLEVGGSIPSPPTIADPVPKGSGARKSRLRILFFVPSTIGRAMRRREDPRLITGRGRYAGDIALPDQAQLVFVRSPQPHATIRSIDPEAAAAMPGVLAVWTATDLPETVRALPDWLPRGVTPRPRTVLADGEVNYVGEAIAAVFADLGPLPAAGNLVATLVEGAPRVHEGAVDNTAGGYERAYGDVEAAFGEGAVVVSETFKLPRIAGAAMEPRAVTAASDGARLRVWTSTQHTYGVRARLAELLALDKAAIEVLAEAVGGGFGPKSQVYPEEIVCALGALRLKRPVRWVATRSEDTATTVHAHGSTFEIELAADPDGRLRGLRGRMWHDIGAFPIACCVESSGFGSEQARVHLGHDGIATAFVGSTGRARATPRRLPRWWRSASTGRSTASRSWPAIPARSSSAR